MVPPRLWLLGFLWLFEKTALRKNKKISDSNLKYYFVFNYPYFIVSVSLMYEVRKVCVFSSSNVN